MLQDPFVIDAAARKHLEPRGIGQPEHETLECVIHVREVFMPTIEGDDIFTVSYRERDGESVTVFGMDR